MTSPPKYALTERIAQGGMAEIHLGKSIGVDGFSRICAFKRILPHYASDADFIQMFKNEADVAKQLHNKNIVQVFDFVSDGNTFMLVMEFVDGQDLRSLLATSEQLRKKIPIEIACYVAMEILAGLAYAHTITDVSGKSLGLIHRDVSPQNILISYDGDIKLTDFGIAKAQNSGSTTRAGVLKGKFRYMSPEQAMGQTIDSRSDLFAVGVILWEMITMQRLFRGEDMAVLEAVRQCKIKAPGLMSTDPVPAELDAIVMKLLSRDLSKRYQNGKEAVRDLSKFIYSMRPDFFGGEMSEFMHLLFKDKVLSAKDRLRSTLALPVGAFGAGGAFEIHDETHSKNKTNSSVVDLTDVKLRAAAQAAADNIKVKAPVAEEKRVSANQALPQGPGKDSKIRPNPVVSPAQSPQQNQNHPNRPQPGKGVVNLFPNQNWPTQQRNQPSQNSSVRKSSSGGSGTEVLIGILAVLLLALLVGAGWMVTKKGSLRPAFLLVKILPEGGPVEIQLNGKAVPKSMLKDSPIRMPLVGARQHQIIVSRPGFKPKVLNVQVPILGGVFEREAALEPGPQPLVNFEVTTVPSGARVTLEGQERSFKTPEIFKNIPMGQTYELKLSHPKCKDSITDRISMTEVTARNKNISRAYRFKSCKP
jgi:serine/threonine protein kinase